MHGACSTAPCDPSHKRLLNHASHSAGSTQGQSCTPCMRVCWSTGKSRVSPAHKLVTHSYVTCHTASNGSTLPSGSIHSMHRHTTEAASCNRSGLMRQWRVHMPAAPHPAQYCMCMCRCPADRKGPIVLQCRHTGTLQPVVHTAVNPTHTSRVKSQHHCTTGSSNAQYCLHVNSQSGSTCAKHMLQAAWDTHALSSRPHTPQYQCYQR